MDFLAILGCETHFKSVVRIKATQGKRVITFSPSKWQTNSISLIVPLATRSAAKIHSKLHKIFNVDRSARRHMERQTQVVLQSVPCHAIEMGQINRRNIHRKNIQLWI